MLLKKALFFLLLSVSLTALCPYVACSQPQVPAKAAPVVDLTGTLSGDQQRRLTLQIRQLQSELGSEIAVLLVPTTGDENLEAFSYRVASQWQLGRKDVLDGVLLLVALQDRQIRIEVGKGLEGAIPDIIAHRIIEEHILPRFREGRFGEGIVAGVNALALKIRGEELPAPARKQLNSPAFSSFTMLAFGGLFLAQILGTFIGRSSGAALGAGMTFVAGVLFGTILLGLVAAFFVYAFSLGGAFGHSNARRRGFLFGGGGFGGGGLGGGGFGGFGSGGSFGGGGASGRW